MGSKEFQELAMNAVFQVNPNIAISEMFVVWMCKTLQNNKLGRTNIELNQTLKERNATIHNQAQEIKRLKSKVGELEYRLYKVYSS